MLKRVIGAEGHMQGNRRVCLENNKIFGMAVLQVCSKVCQETQVNLKPDYDWP